MSGAGVQSAMRRRTRPAEEPRRQTTSVGSSISGQQTNQNAQGANPRLINPGQILYMHEAKIRELEKSLSNIGVLPESGGTTDEDRFSKLKTEIESGFEKRISVISNNLNFVLNALNEERAKTKILETTLEELRRKYEETDKNVLAKLDSKEFTEFREEYNNKLNELASKNNSQDNISVETNTIGTVETVELSDGIQESEVEPVTEPVTQPQVDTDLDAPITADSVDGIQSLSLDTETLEQLNTLTMGDLVGTDNGLKEGNIELSVN